MVPKPTVPALIHFMKAEKSHHTKNKREFGGCVELMPPQPEFIEFIDARRIWAFAIDRLAYFVMQENPNPSGAKTLPPDQLILIFISATVVLKGWRLENVVGPLLNRRVMRIHAEKHLGTLIIEEAWVSEIHVLLPDNTILQPDRLANWIAEQP